MSEPAQNVIASVCGDAQQFYKRPVDIGLETSDTAGPEVDFIERYLQENSEVSEAVVRQTKHAFIFTKKLLAGKKKRKNKRIHNLLTVKEKRRLGIFNVTEGDITYETFLKIHDLWKGYFRSAVSGEKCQNLESLQASLMKADYTGCHFVIVASKCATYIGMKGLVLQETKNVFRLINKEDQIVNIPKAGSMFAFTLDDKLFKIYGSHFRKHSFERGKTKFKVTENVEL